MVKLKPAIMPFSIPVFYGSVRDTRKGVRAARFVVSQLKDAGLEPVLIDPIEYDLPLMRRMYKTYKEEQPPELLQRLATIIRDADGFVVVTGEYNHTMPPALTNLMAHFLEEYFHRPVGIVSYSSGRISGARAAMHARNMLGEMGMAVIPTEYSIPHVHKAFEEDGTPTDPKMPEFIADFITELTWYIKVMRDGRQKYGVPY